MDKITNLSTTLNDLANIISVDFRPLQISEDGRRWLPAKNILGVTVRKAGYYITIGDKLRYTGLSLPEGMSSFSGVVYRKACVQVMARPVEPSSFEMRRFYYFTTNLEALEEAKKLKKKVRKAKRKTKRSTAVRDTNKAPKISTIDDNADGSTTVTVPVDCDGRIPASVSVTQKGEKLSVQLNF